MVNNSSTRFISATGLTFQANLKIEPTQFGEEYLIGEIKVVKSIDNFTLDLLSPNFSNSFACSWKCFSLGSRVNDDSNEFNSLLSLYLNTYRIDIERLYQNLTKLDIYLLSLSPDKQLTPYKELIAKQQSGHKFSTLDEFNIYLETLNGSLESSHFKLMSDEDVSKALLELKYRHVDLRKVKQLFKESDDNTSVKSSNRPFTLEATVCSYSDNSYGRVVRFNEDEITIFIIGQAVIPQDGYFVYADPGYLFKNNKNITFNDINSIKTYNKSDIALCDINS